MRYKTIDRERVNRKIWVAGLFTSFAALVCMGNLNLRSAVFLSRFERLAQTQMVWSFLGIGSAIVIGFFLPRLPWKWIAMIGVPIILISMIALAQYGDSIGGSTRWFETPFGSIQPSEFAKPVLIVGIAWVLSSIQIPILGLILSGLIAGAVALMVFFEPDLGTALVFGFLWVMLGFFYVRRFYRYIVILAVFLVLLVTLGLPQLRDYQRARLLAFINPTAYPETYYHTRQSMILVGSGQWVGSGFMRGEGNLYGFIPADHTDFVLAVFAEEWGWLGMLVFLSAWSFLLMMLVRMLMDATGIQRYLILGSYSVLGFQFVMNTAMVLGLAPVTGIPSPFFSYGGSSMLNSSILIGLSIHASLNPDT